MFKSKLDAGDRIRTDTIVIKIDEEKLKANPPKTATVPMPIPAHLRKAADNELEDMLDAKFVEPVKGETDSSSRGFFREKQTSKDETRKVRLVSDFKEINRVIQRPNYPFEGSSQILKRLEPDQVVFACLDMSSGYHQCELAEESRDLFTIILPQGKYRFCVLPQVVSAECNGDRMRTKIDPTEE